MTAGNGSKVSGTLKSRVPDTLMPRAFLPPPRPPAALQKMTRIRCRSLRASVTSRSSGSARADSSASPKSSRNSSKRSAGDILFRNDIPHALRESFRDATLEERAALGILIHQLVTVLGGILHHAVVVAVDMPAPPSIAKQLTCHRGTPPLFAPLGVNSVTVGIMRKRIETARHAGTLLDRQEPAER